MRAKKRKEKEDLMRPGRWKRVVRDAAVSGLGKVEQWAYFKE